MKNQNNSLEKNNIFSKIKSWLYNIFYKSKKSNETSMKNEVTTINKNEESSMFEEYIKKNERHNYLLQLQKKYENKSISENEINESDKFDLELLYIEQINNLKRKIRTVESKIKTLH